MEHVTVPGMRCTNIAHACVNVVALAPNPPVEATTRCRGFEQDFALEKLGLLLRNLN